MPGFFDRVVIPLPAGYGEGLQRLQRSMFGAKGFRLRHAQRLSQMIANEQMKRPGRFRDRGVFCGPGTPTDCQPLWQDRWPVRARCLRLQAEHPAREQDHAQDLQGS